MVILFMLDEPDEIKAYLDCRYLSAPEAFWRIFGFKLFGMSHSVCRLAVHLENDQQHYFSETADIGPQNLPEERQTTLMAWFKYNAENQDARDLYYHEFPQHFKWVASDKEWVKRRNQGGQVGRVYFVNPSAGECYYLRLLLHHIPGCTSFQDLRTVNGTVYGTYKEAAQHLGLLDDDAESRQCLQEACGFQMPRQLRQLFCFQLIFNDPVDPNGLFEEFWEDLCEDFLLSMDADAAKRASLLSMNNIMRVHGKSIWEILNIPPIQDAMEMEPEIINQVDVDDLVSKLTPEQRLAFDSVVEAVNGDPKLFFLDGPGGTGKTFLIECLYHYVKQQGHDIHAVASSGIAAMLLPNGRTAHSLLKIPIDIDADSTCSIKAQSLLARTLREAKCLIWDEAPMTHRHAFEAVDRTLRDIRQCDEPFGGLTVLFSGDFRQCAPVVPRGLRPDIVNATLKRCSFWPVVRTLRLTRNLRLTGTEDEQESLANYSNWLLDIGNGNLDTVEFPAVVDNVDQLVEHVYNGNDSSDNALLCSTNAVVDDLNEKVLARLPGEVTEYLSSDSIVSENTDANFMYPVEQLNRMTISGLPPHSLKLKVGCIVMLLRNMDPKKGLCNGTRLKVMALSRRLIEASIIGGPFDGNQVFIPRIALQTNDGNLPFTLTRKQFPIRLAYAMTINKSQGQSLGRVGLYLERPVFSHGQLYVALSRVTNPNGLKVFCPGNTTPNVVYQEILR